VVLSAQTGMADYDVSHSQPRTRRGESFGEASHIRYWRLFASGGPPSGRGGVCRRRRASHLGDVVRIASFHTGKSRRSGPLRLSRPRGDALRRDSWGRREGPVRIGPGLPVAGAVWMGLSAENTFKLKPGGEPSAVVGRVHKGHTCGEKGRKHQCLHRRYAAGGFRRRNAQQSHLRDAPSSRENPRFVMTCARKASSSCRPSMPSMASSRPSTS
jgi:hypothetical protein